jgi:hypothetical protein
MAKAKPVARTRRAYEYDHQYGLGLHPGRASKASKRSASQAETSRRPTKSKTIARGAKKR